jgi:hypothetical protein
MTCRFLVQPPAQIGTLLTQLLNGRPRPTRVVLVSAFASLQTLLRLRPSIRRLARAHARIRLVLGIDLGGTSKEALEEAHSWDIDTRLVKHRQGGHTFHPKLYLVESSARADIVICSSNITDGGFFTNYESGVQLTFTLPRERRAYDWARGSLGRFLEPQGPTCQVLSDELLRRLLARRDIPTVEEQRRARTGEAAASEGEASPFGADAISPPPPLPAEVLSELLTRVRSARRPPARLRRRRADGVRKPAAQIAPTSFYMTLPAMRGSIPGEARIPLDARDLAPFFWGWRNRYRYKRGPRRSSRAYWGWKPRWRIWDSANPRAVRPEPVRMYVYVNSSDFRFYAHRLLALGADAGDIVRITRVSDPEAEFECVLARRSTRRHAQWLRCCTEAVHNSNRRYGYA